MGLIADKFAMAGRARNIYLIMILAIFQLVAIGCGRINFSLTTPSLAKFTTVISTDQTQFSIPEGSVVSLGILMTTPMPTDTVIKVNLTGSTNDVATSFDPLPASVTIPAGSLSKRLTIQSRSTAIYHKNSRSYDLTLSSDDPRVKFDLNQVTIEVTDPKSPPTVQFASATQSVSETSTSPQINVSLNYASTEPITVAYSAANGTAVSGTNYTLSSGTLTIPALSSTAAIPFTVVHDGLDTADLTFTATLGAITGSATLGTPATATITILDADNVVPPNPTLALSDPTTSSTSYARQTAINISIGNDATAAKWCVSQTQTTMPANGTATCTGGAGGANGWYTSEPTTFTLSSGDGSKTVYVWVADAANVVNTSAVSTSITLDTNAPTVPTVALSDPNTGSTSATNQSLINLSITNDTGVAKWCVIEQATATAAPSAPLYNNGCFSSSEPTTQTLGATGSRTVYVYVQDAAGNVSSAAATASITYSTTAPANPTLALTDPTTGSASYARQVAVDAAIGNDATAVRWCLSATQTTKPATGTATCNGGAGPGDGWLTARPTTTNIPTGDGSKTLTLWIADAYNNVSATAVTDSITLDTARPATPTVAMSDSVTSSTTTSYQVTANLSITSDTDAVAWCTFLQSDVAAAPTAPLFDDACWAGARPTTIDLAADGNRKVYVYTKDVAGNVSAAAATATITKASVAKLSVLGSLTINTNTCSAYRVVTTDSSNWPTEVSSALSVSISANNGAGLYSDSGCSTSTATVSLSKAGKVGTFYMKNASAATVTLSASATGPSAGSLTVSTVTAPTGVISMAAGPNYTCFVKNDGALKCSGQNWRNRMLGDGSAFNTATPVSVTGVSGAVDVKGTETLACVLINDGTVKCWGAGWAGQLGDGNWSTSATPVSVSGLTGVTQIGVGLYHVCALKNDGTVYCWGANYNGRLGNGTYANAGVPTQASVTNVVSLMVSRNTSCAVINDGTIKCWGSNADATYGNGTYTESTTPVSVPGISNVISLSGSLNMCAVLSNETAKCWGPGWNGTIGDGTANSSTTPVSVTGVTGAVKIASSYFFNCAILRTGGAKCWGVNSYGTLGDGTTTSSNSPVTVTAASGIADMLSGGENLFHQCARLTDGTAKCWGSIAYGEGGDGVSRDITSPTTVSGTGTATAVAAGSTHTCSIAGGLVSCWGLGWNDLLGTGNYVGAYTPSQVSNVSGASVIRLGVEHSCALVSGALKCWGANNEGQLGDGTNTYRTAPPASPNAGGTVTEFDLSDYTTCAVLSTGALKCWGGNDEGQIGDGTSTNRSLPTQVSGLTSGVSTVGTGAHHTCAALSAGGIKCWGRNWAGHLGNGTTTDSNVPTDVSGVSAVATMLALGENHSCALISGGVKCWGANWSGQLGTGDWTNRSAPTDVSGLTSGVTAISAKGETTCALLSGGTVKCWGKNGNYQLGDSTFTDSNTPVDVAGLTGVSSIAVGLEHTCALVSNDVKCWGANGRQQSGIKSWVTTPVTAVP